jgi:hypothetical protein
MRQVRGFGLCGRQERLISGNGAETMAERGTEKMTEWLDIHLENFSSEEKTRLIEEIFGFTPPFGDVGRGLVYPAPLRRGDTHCYTASISHAGTPPPLLPALHVPHRDRCCDAPPEPRNRDIPRPPPQPSTATTPPLPGRGRPVAPAGMGHALACLAGPAGSGGSGDRGAPGQTSGASASSDD